MTLYAFTDVCILCICSMVSPFRLDIMSFICVLLSIFRMIHTALFCSFCNLLRLVLFRLSITYELYSIFAVSIVRCLLTLLSTTSHWDILPFVTPMWWFQSRHVPRNTPRYLHWLTLSSSWPLTVIDGYIRLWRLFWVPKRVHFVILTFICNLFSFNQKVALVRSDSNTCFITFSSKVSSA